MKNQTLPLLVLLMAFALPSQLNAQVSNYFYIPYMYLSGPSSISRESSAEYTVTIYAFTLRGSSYGVIVDVMDDDLWPNPDDRLTWRFKTIRAGVSIFTTKVKFRLRCTGGKVRGVGDANIGQARSSGERTAEVYALIKGVYKTGTKKVKCL